MLHSPLSYTHMLFKQTIHPGDTVIDATVGNGHDTLLLADLVGTTGHVIGFDIQEAAIHATQDKINSSHMEERVKLFHKGHEDMDSVLTSSTELSLVVYNLGYLPSGDKTIVTHPETTIKSIEQSLKYLKKNGLVLLMIYYGHEGGKEEKDAVVNFVEQLPQKNFSVLNYQFINQQNTPPFLLAIEKR